MWPRSRHWGAMLNDIVSCFRKNAVARTPRAGAGKIAGRERRPRDGLQERPAISVLRRHCKENPQTALAREGIRVNALCPGPLKTKMLMSFLDTDQKRQRRLVHIPMGRFGEAHEMAKAALYLASDESSYMTGSELVIDGGLTAM